MREILFRGKTADNGEWVEGCLLCYYGYPTIITKDDYDFAYTSNTCYDGEVTEVIPETISEFTGLCDKNGKRIFEGDILKGMGSTLFVYFDKSLVRFDWEKISGEWFESFSGFADEYEIIGNIHDNSLEDFENVC